jgi:ATP-dependent Clp protease ATP-binding subunit ClpB
MPSASGSSVSAPGLSRAAMSVLEAARELMAAMGDSFVSTDHLLLALAKTGRFGLDAAAIEAASRGCAAGGTVDSENPEGTFDALAKYGTDLTERAREGKLDPVIGRDAEIRRVVQVLSRRTKNNPVLIGEPGVGKTAVVEGWPSASSTATCPRACAARSSSASTSARWWPGRSTAASSRSGSRPCSRRSRTPRVRSSPSSTSCTPSSGPGRAARAAMDAGNMLKPLLARGELRLVGATTLDEYRKHIEKDAALERRFQQVFVGEPSVEDTIAILRGLKERYEAHHKVEIEDSALVAAATLSDRYITGRQLPDKAIDLVDEAASRLRMEIDSSPVEIDQLQRTVDRMRMEELHLAKETDAASAERLERLRKDLADKTEDLAALNARWEAEKSGLNRVGELKARLDDLRTQAERLQREANYEGAARLLYGEIPTLEKELASAQESEVTARAGSATPAEAPRAGGPEREPGGRHTRTSWSRTASVPTTSPR